MCMRRYVLEFCVCVQILLSLCFCFYFFAVWLCVHGLELKVISPAMSTLYMQKSNVDSTACQANPFNRNCFNSEKFAYLLILIASTNFSHFFYLKIIIIILQKFTVSLK